MTLPPCKHDTPRTGCHFCTVALAHPAFKQQWLSSQVKSRSVAVTCKHLGEYTGRLVECQGCRGKTQLKVFGCGKHGECTQGKRVEQLACCAGCPDRESA